MYIKRVLSAAAVCCLCIAALAGTAGAQFGFQRTPTLGGLFNPVIGSGADYDMTTSKGEKMTMGISIVGSDTINGKQGYWMEIAVTGGKLPQPMYMKSLSVVDGNSMMTQRMIMMINGTAYQMPDQMVQTNSKPMQTNAMTDGQNLGSEPVTVPAGTFTADHYKTKEGDDLWISKDAGPWSLVKMQTHDGTTMVLTKVVHDAKDQITGTPVPFSPMAMAQAQQAQHH
jgi:hypothetical protein